MLLTAEPSSETEYSVLLCHTVAAIQSRYDKCYRTNVLNLYHYKVIKMMSQFNLSHSWTTIFFPFFYQQQISSLHYFRHALFYMNMQSLRRYFLLIVPPQSFPFNKLIIFYIGCIGVILKLLLLTWPKLFFLRFWFFNFFSREWQINRIIK